MTYEACASFLFVYIAEAHAMDEWPIGDQCGNTPGRAVIQPKSLPARLKEAKHFADRFALCWPMAVDIPELGDPFLSAYAPWPTRFYVVRAGLMEFVAFPNKYYAFDLDDLEAALVSLFPSSENAASENAASENAAKSVLEGHA